MRRFKIALVCDWYLPRVGGLELHLFDLLRELGARGHDAHLICVTPGPHETDTAKVRRLAEPLMPRIKTIRDPKVMDRLERILVEERFDIVHSHNSYSPFAHAGMYVANRLRMPSVFTEHSVLRGYGVNLFGALDRVFGWTRWPTVLTGVSRYIAEDLRQVSGRDDALVLWNGVRPSSWTVRRVDGHPPRVIHVGRFFFRKQQADLVRAIPRILKRLPRERWPRFTFVGDGPQRPRVERLAKRLGVAEHVEFAGLRSRAEIRELFASSTVFALPSEKEALPICVLEARSAGLPVVARAPNGVADLIAHGREGFLAETADQFADGIARIVGDRALWSSMHEHSTRGLDRFTWDQVIDRHENVYTLATQRAAGQTEILLDRCANVIADDARRKIA